MMSLSMARAQLEVLLHESDSLVRSKSTEILRLQGEASRLIVLNSQLMATIDEHQWSRNQMVGTLNAARRALQMGLDDQVYLDAYLTESQALLKSACQDKSSAKRDFDELFSARLRVESEQTQIIADQLHRLEQQTAILIQMSSLIEEQVPRIRDIIIQENEAKSLNNTLNRRQDVTRAKPCNESYVSESLHEQQSADYLLIEPFETSGKSEICVPGTLIVRSPFKEDDLANVTTVSVAEIKKLNDEVHSAFSEFVLILNEYEKEHVSREEIFDRVMRLEASERLSHEKSKYVAKVLELPELKHAIAEISVLIDDFREEALEARMVKSALELELLSQCQQISSWCVEKKQLESSLWFASESNKKLEEKLSAMCDLNSTTRDQFRLALMNASMELGTTHDLVENLSSCICILQAACEEAEYETIAICESCKTLEHQVLSLEKIQAARAESEHRWAHHFDIFMNQAHSTVHAMSSFLRRAHYTGQRMISLHSEQFRMRAFCLSMHTALNEAVMCIKEAEQCISCQARQLAEKESCISEKSKELALSRTLLADASRQVSELKESAQEHMSKALVFENQVATAAATSSAYKRCFQEILQQSQELVATTCSAKRLVSSISYDHAEFNTIIAKAKFLTINLVDDIAQFGIFTGFMKNDAYLVAELAQRRDSLLLDLEDIKKLLSEVTTSVKLENDACNLKFSELKKLKNEADHGCELALKTSKELQESLKLITISQQSDEENIKRLSLAVRDLKIEGKRLEDEKWALMLKLNDTDALRLELQAEVNSCREIMKQMQDHINEVDKAAIVMQSTSNRLSNDLNLTRAKEDHLYQELTNAQHVIEDFESRATMLAESKHSLEQQYLSQSSELASFKSDLSELSRLLCSLEHDLVNVHHGTCGEIKEIISGYDYKIKLQDFRRIADTIDTF